MSVQPRPCLIGIAGGTGSGKTTATALIRSRFPQQDLCLIEQDCYYRDRSHLSLEERQHINYDHPDAVDFDLMAEQLQQLVSGYPVGKPRYCFATHSRAAGFDTIHPAPIIVLEGILALWDPRIRALLDLKIYMDADADLRFIRRLRRDVSERGRTVESVVSQYLETVRPMHERYIEPMKAYADCVIRNESYLAALEAGLDAVLSRIQKSLTVVAQRPSSAPNTPGSRQVVSTAKLDTVSGADPDPSRTYESHTQS